MQENQAKIAIYGAGGHGRIIYSILKENGEKVSLIFDEQAKDIIDKIPVQKPNPELLKKHKLIVAIGNNSFRKNIADSLNLDFYSVISQNAYVHNSVKIGEGTSIIHGVVINILAKIGKHVIINSNATVEHDVIIHDFVHIAQNAVCSGGCEIGEGTYIGPGAVVMPGVKVGKWSKISPNAVITKHIADNSIV